MRGLESLHSAEGSRISISVSVDAHVCIISRIEDVEGKMGEEIEKEGKEKGG